MSPVRMYSTTWCGYCRRLKRQLAEAGIDFEEVDLDQVGGRYDAMIKAASGGYRTVPTVDIGGRLYVNPSLEEVRRALV